MSAEKKEIRKGPKVVGSVILVIVAIVAVVAGSRWAIDNAKYVSTDDAAIDGKQVKLSSRTLGRVAGIAVKEGDKVSTGDVLVTLDATDLRAQEAQARASLATARQNVEISKINLGKSEDDFDRLEKLYKGGATTKENYVHAQSALEAARAQNGLAQAQLDTSNAQLGVIEAQLLNTKISTPIDGTVDKITLGVGGVAQPGQTILSVNNLESVWVIANLEETKIGRIKAGARVVVTVDAYGSREFPATVELIRSGIVAPAFQIGEFTKTTQRIPVKIRFENLEPGLTLLPGMSAEVRIRTNTPLPGFLDK